MQHLQTILVVFADDSFAFADNLIIFANIIWKNGIYISGTSKYSIPGFLQAWSPVTSLCIQRSICRNVNTCKKKDHLAEASVLSFLYIVVAVVVVVVVVSTCVCLGFPAAAAYAAYSGRGYGYPGLLAGYPAGTVPFLPLAVHQLALLNLHALHHQ